MTSDPKRTPKPSEAARDAAASDATVATPRPKARRGKRGQKRAPAVAESRDSSPRRLSPDQRRTQILHAVVELLEQRPYAEVGVGDVARAAGITEGLVYHYFESRLGLFTAAVRATAQELLLACVPPQSELATGTFDYGLRAYLDYVSRHPMAYVNLLQGPVAEGAPVAPIIDGARAAIIAYAMHVLGFGPERPLPALRMSLQGFVGYAEAVVLRWLKEHRELQPARPTVEHLLRRAFVVAVAEGVRAEASPPWTERQVRAFEAALAAHPDSDRTPD